MATSRFTSNYRSIVTAMVEDLESNACTVRVQWKGQDEETAADVHQTAAITRNAIAEMRKTLDAVEEVLKQDLYDSVTR